jgi:hypothetical protein
MVSLDEETKLFCKASCFFRNPSSPDLSFPFNCQCDQLENSSKVESRYVNIRPRQECILSSRYRAMYKEDSDFGIFNHD